MATNYSKRKIIKPVEHTAWKGMKQRCYNPNSPFFFRYGGRGVGVCKRWRDSFSNFFYDMGEKPSQLHSLDRIDNDWHYTPENCRWATKKEQANNRKVRQNRVFLTLKGFTETIDYWSEKTGLPVPTIMIRRRRGWTDARILTTESNRDRFRT